MLTAIEHATRRIRILGATAHPGGQWIVQQARNLCMDLDQAGADVKFVLHDRDAIFHEGFDAVFTAAGLRIVRSGVRMPRMKPRVAYCTSSGRCAVFWCRPGQTVAVGSDILLAVSGVSGVVRRRWVSLRPCARAGGVGPGGGVEALAFVVVRVCGEESGVVPDLDGAGGDAELCGDLGQGEHAGVAEALLWGSPETVETSSMRFRVIFADCCLLEHPFLPGFLQQGFSLTRELFLLPVSHGVPRSG